MPLYKKNFQYPPRQKFNVFKDALIAIKKYHTGTSVLESQDQVVTYLQFSHLFSLEHK